MSDFERNSVGDPIAWVLYEKSSQGKERTEGIALTHEAKEAFMRGYYEIGGSRSALPFKLKLEGWVTP